MDIVSHASTCEHFGCESMDAVIVQKLGGGAQIGGVQLHS